MEENKRIHTAKEEWDAYSDEYFAENASEEIVGRIIEDPSWAFPAPVWDMILSSYPNIRGKNVLVPSSGDNAAFDAGFNITHMEEFHPDKSDHSLWFYKNQAQAEADNYMKFDWKRNPWAVLPQWIGFSARKYGGNI